MVLGSPPLSRTCKSFQSLSILGGKLSTLEGRGESHLLKTTFGRVGGENETEQRGGGWELSHCASGASGTALEQCISNKLSWGELGLVPPSGSEGRQA